MDMKHTAMMKVLQEITDLANEAMGSSLRKAKSTPSPADEVMQKGVEKGAEEVLESDDSPAEESKEKAVTSSDEDSDMAKLLKLKAKLK